MALEGGDHLAYYRFAVPVTPLVAVLSVEVLARLAERLESAVHGVPGFVRDASVGALAIAISAGSSLVMAGTVRYHGLSEQDRRRWR